MAEGPLWYTRLDDPPETIATTQGRPLIRPTSTASSTSTTGTSRRAASASSWSAGRPRCAATTTRRSTTPPRSPPTATCAPATWSGSPGGHLMVAGRIRT
ncbi:hypothetical protein V2I01_41605 [Micromonospora sp. BRA006-A]|nr:hypothetical protein [Micromonospora sp. BRA006-A]